MGRATISTNIGEGEYTITPIYDTARAEARKITLENDIVNLDTQITTTNNELTAANTARDELIVEMNAAITDAKANTPAGKEFNAAYTEIISAFTTHLVTVDSVILKLNIILSRSQLAKVSKTKEIDLIDAALLIYENPQNVEAWCADYSIELTGEVGTIELDDETNAPNNQALIIEPLGDTDTKTTQPAISSGFGQEFGYSAIFYNLCALPAFQKYKPRYRQGKITSIDYGADTCNVTFNAEYEYSSIVGYDTTKYSIFQSPNLTDVPIVYGICDSLVFNIDDQVVVFFNDDWTTPQVIGFIDHPKICGLEMFFNMTGTIVGSQVMSAEIDDTTSDISYLTTAFGLAGNVDWKSGLLVNDVRISWDGPVGRSISPPIILFSGNDLNDYTGQGRDSQVLVDDADNNKDIILTYTSLLWGTSIYKDGLQYAQLSSGNLKITGASFNNGFLIINAYDQGSVGDYGKDYIYIQSVKDGPFYLIYTHVYDETLYYVFPRMTPAFFNEDGTKCLLHSSRILKTLVTDRLQLFEYSGYRNTLSSEASIDMVEVEITEIAIDLSLLDAPTFVVGDLTGTEVSATGSSASSLYNPLTTTSTQFDTTPISDPAPASPQKSYRMDATIDGSSFNACADWYIDGVGVEHINYFNITTPAEIETVIEDRAIWSVTEEDSWVNLKTLVTTSVIEKSALITTTYGGYSNSITLLDQNSSHNFYKNEDSNPSLIDMYGYTKTKALESNHLVITYIDLRDISIITKTDTVVISMNGLGTVDFDPVANEFHTESAGNVTLTSNVEIFNGGVLQGISSEIHTSPITYNRDWTSTDVVPPDIKEHPLASNVPYDLLDVSATAITTQHQFAFEGSYYGEQSWVFPGGDMSLFIGSYAGFGTPLLTDNPTFNIGYEEVRPAYLKGSIVGNHKAPLASSFAGASITKDKNIFLISRSPLAVKGDTLDISYGNGVAVIQTDGVSLLETAIGDGGTVTTASFPKNFT